MPNQLIQFWNDCALLAPPYIHPQDLELISRNHWRSEEDPVDFKTYVASSRFGDREDFRFHLALMPTPYVGNIDKADIVVLMLNPGFDHSDYWAEYSVPDLRTRLRQTLVQSFEGADFPFLFLDPDFCWHGGFRWWEGKLRGVIRQIATEKFGGDYWRAMKDLSERLACIELVPYHSSWFNDHRLFDRLPSIITARRFVSETLRSEAEAGRRLLIITRQAGVWGFHESAKNIVVYKGGQTRGASLGPSSEGGRAILGWYGITQGLHGNNYPAGNNPNDSAG